MTKSKVLVIDWHQVHLVVDGVEINIFPDLSVITQERVLNPDVIASAVRN